MSRDKCVTGTGCLAVVLNILACSLDCISYQIDDKGEISGESVKN